MRTSLNSSRLRRTNGLGTRFDRWWVALWTANTVLLGGLILANVRPSTWLASAVALFFIPEAIGLARAGDSLPPLTFVIRRYVPRWAVDAAVFGFGAFAAMTWWSSPHRTAVIVAIAATVGWLINHFDVAFDGPGE